jgi:putative transposase
MRNAYPLTGLCEAFEVSRSGFHAWAAGQRDRRQARDAELSRRVCAAFAASRQSYGYPRLTVELRAQGERVGKARVARLMQAAGLQGRPRRAFRPRTTQSNHAGPIAPNRLQAAPPPTARDQVWQTDITYVPTGAGWLYLAVVLDAYSKRVLGWAFSAAVDAALAVAAVHMALQTRGGRCPAGLVVHSDRGAQYASAAFRALLAQHRIVGSMSRRGNCYDNARAESFFSTLKTELVHRRRFRDHAHARAVLFEWLAAFYNLRRRHSSIGNLSPVDFENQSN